jgi:hypothetical protein
MDHVSFEFTLGIMRVQTVQALLDPVRPRRMAAHRLTLRLPRGVFIGLAESVVYTGRALDFAYLIPVASFYANQYNEKVDDNVLWSIDIKLPVYRGVLLYGELLFDDFQYEADPPAPNKWGFDLNAEWQFMLGGHEVELRAGYQRIAIYTYTHKDSLATQYLTGGGNRLEDRIIGSDLGPDADRWMLNVTRPFNRRFTASLEAALMRYGEGADMRPWDWGNDPDPSFPSGGVTRENRVTAAGFIDLGGGSVVSARGGWRMLERAAGATVRDGFGSLEIVWDF